MRDWGLSGRAGRRVRDSGRPASALVADDGQERQDGDETMWKQRSVDRGGAASKAGKRTFKQSQTFKCSDGTRTEGGRAQQLVGDTADVACATIGS